MIFYRHANLKYKYGNCYFWCRWYYVDAVGRNEGAIKGYIKNKLEEKILCQTKYFSKNISTRPQVLKQNKG